MESSKSATSGSGKSFVGRSKTPAIPASSRLQRNLAEKERRDKLNGFISELATLIPMVSNATKPLDKVSILRLAAAEMRLHFSCLNPKKYKKKPLVLPPSIMSSLDLIEKTIGGFVMVTTLTGLIVFCSRSIEEYLGYQNIDVMGNKVVKYIYEDDIKFFESNVNSVVRSLKRTHKKTKVIKAHMLQKPLPRSTETCRPRNMIFKISVHQNDTSGDNGLNSNGLPHPGKTRPQKDFGYSAVVLLFIEPVRLEPEIDITYIESNQDIYFTRHGLQGEIIYADQRISTITGYMPHDVQGTSAYQYICSSDVPIALFAQKAMFTSPDGKGVIVYRLRIRDMRCIYLQSSGQIAYKESTNEISHFVCFNRLLCEEEGSQELKKFQQRFAPQIMAAKMLQVKQNHGSTSPTTDLAFEQVMKLINSTPKTEVASTSSQTNSFACSSISPSDASPSIADQKLNKSVTSDSSFPVESVPSTSGFPMESVVPPSVFPMESNFVHSSECHSANNSVDTLQPVSITLDCPPTYVSEEHIDAILERPEQRLGGGPLRRTECSSSLSSSPYKTMTVRKGKPLTPEQCRNIVDKLDPAVVNEKLCNSPNVYDEMYGIHQNKQYISIKSQNGTVHFVNVKNNLLNSTNLNGTQDVHSNQSMVFDPTLPQKITFQLATSQPGQNTIHMTGVDEQLRENLSCREHVSISNSQTSGSIDTVEGMICDQLNFNERQSHASLVPHTDYMSNPMYDATSVPSLLKNSNLSLQSDFYDGVDYSQNLNSYPQNDSYNNCHFTRSISSYNNGADVNTYNDFGNSNFTDFNCSEMKGLYETVAPSDEFKTISPMEIFDSTRVPIEEIVDSVTLQHVAQNKANLMGANSYGTENKTTVNQKSSRTALFTNNGHTFSDSIDWNDILSSDPTDSEEIPLNNELYYELESFFRSSQESAVVKGISELPIEISNYSQNSRSSDYHTIYQQ